MNTIKTLFAILFVSVASTAKPQSKAVDSTRFFTEEGIINMSFSTDVRELQNSKGEEVYQTATVSLRFPDSTVINETIRAAARGHFRRDNCVIPPLLLNFHNETSLLLSPLGKLKLVIGCGTATADEQLILKEFLCYKIYNLLTPKSFRARLVRVNYSDTRNKLKSFSQYAFFIEDDNDMAERNGCEKRDKAQFLTESTDRETMTMVAVFEYMISNGDWSVPNNHNTKLIFRKNEQTLPFVVPYDFDHSGFVNAGYALPNELLGTETVTERVYRGFPRTMEELQTTFDIFRKNKEAITSLIMNFSLLASKTRKEAVEYLSQFYTTINNKKEVQNIFIDNARTQ
ncbi:MAG: hypothetical protein HZB42_05455 [Sphingobacteriales bacterium]|nr:hypothetical protein [Sphingobacteriales bacterium]